MAASSWSFPLLLALVLLSLVAGEVWDSRYQPRPGGRCPPGYRYNYGICERAFDSYPTPRRPYDPPPQDLRESVPISCPEGFKAARGVCSKMSEREIELDRQPKDPCPPGQRRSRLVCRPYIYN